MVWTTRKSASKYYANSTRFGDRVYHSKFEARIAQDLDLERKSGKYTEVIPQFKVSLDVNGYHITNYYVDFRCNKPDGSYDLIEVKGYETDIWRMKRKLLEATYLVEHPEVKYIVIK